MEFGVIKECIGACLALFSATAIRHLPLVGFWFSGSMVSIYWLSAQIVNAQIEITYFE